jgi:hypothetical protein
VSKHLHLKRMWKIKETLQYKNRTVCVGCMEKNISFQYISLCSLFTLCNASVSALQIVLVTVLMKLLQNGRQVGLLVRV